MNEPKKRGRPSKADIAARDAKQEPGQVPQMNGDTEHWPEMGGQLLDGSSAAYSAPLPTEAVNEVFERAQAYALRVWAGQSESLGRGERIERIKRALEGQSLPFDGVKLPGGSDDEDWTEEDMQPVTWRKASA